RSPRRHRARRIRLVLQQAVCLYLLPIASRICRVVPDNRGVGALDPPAAIVLRHTQLASKIVVIQYYGKPNMARGNPSRAASEAMASLPGRDYHELAAQNLPARAWFNLLW